MNKLHISSEAAMRISLEKESSVVTSESEFFGGGVRSPWDNSSDSSIPKSRLVNLNMGASAHDSHSTKLLCFQFRDQDSSSTTQSTGQSDSEVVSIKGSTNLYGQTSGHDKSSGKTVIAGHQAKQIPSMGAQEFMFASQLDCGQAIAHIPLQYAEPYFGGLLAAATYGPQAMNYHSQFVGVSPARVPLPLGHLTEDEPIYVNAKQYGAILRRRQSRAKLEAQNKLVKARKPYLHESRHLHALKRARGSGGRFLTAKEIRGSKDGSENNNNKKEGSSATSCSEVTSGANGDVFRQREFRFSGYTAGHMHHQNHHHVSARQ